MVKKAVFFDLDHTLCRVNVSLQFGLYLFRKSLFPWHKMFPLFISYLLCKRGWIGLQHLHIQAAKTLFQGKELIFIESLVGDFLDQINEMLQPEIWAHFREAKAAGYYTALLSNSPCFLVKEIARRLGFDTAKGTEYATNNGKICPEITRHMEGAEKAEFVAAELLRLGLKREDAMAYSDSFLDLPFLESVGIPIAVNPDKKLLKHAKNRGWRVICPK